MPALDIIMQYLKKNHVIMKTFYRSFSLFILLTGKAFIQFESIIKGITVIYRNCFQFILEHQIRENKTLLQKFMEQKL